MRVSLFGGRRDLIDARDVFNADLSGSGGLQAPVSLLSLPYAVIYQHTTQSKIWRVKEIYTESEKEKD
jgi:hypothetical protein